jgi:hypothetical protein
MLRQGAGWAAARDPLPTPLRAVLGYYADSGVFDPDSLRLKRRVDGVSDRLVGTAFAAVEDRLAEAFGGPVSFDYDTKLILPAELTLGYLYRRAEADDDRAEELTRLAIEALIDGDMRDAINDDEFGDFEVTVRGAPASPDRRRRAAELAQETLRERVEGTFADLPGEVRDRYEWAVGVSEAHQEQDPHFRELMRGADAGDAEALAAIEREYRDAEFETVPEAFAGEDLPYAKTQYDRVGVIYDGMIGMYRAAGLPVSEAFEASIVLAIVGAQVWLDDVDDYAADTRAGQLTPVTAEYLLAESDRTAYRRVVEVTEAYLDRAKEYATAADSALTGIATEYIYRSGEPGTLPGSGG